MSGAHSISTRRAYGVQRICRVWERARSSVYARRHATRSRAPWCRRGPVAAPDEVLRPHPPGTRSLAVSGEGYRKAWAKLRVAGTPDAAVDAGAVQAPHRAGHAHGPKAHDGTITTEAPDVMWGTDSHGDGRRGGGVRVRGCRSLYDRSDAAKSGSRFEALEPWTARAWREASAPSVSPAGFVFVTRIELPGR